MSSNDDGLKVTKIPPISKTEAEAIMKQANKDVDDAERVIKGESIHMVRPFVDKSFKQFCQDYKEMKSEKDT